MQVKLESVQKEAVYSQLYSSAMSIIVTAHVMLKARVEE